MRTVLNKGEKLKCPHCGEIDEFDPEVEAYCVPGRIGQASTEKCECNACDKSFYVTCISSDVYEVVSNA